jgi:hypothetical protein
METLRLPLAQGWLKRTTELIRIPEPPPGTPSRAYRIPFKAGVLNVISDPSPPKPEDSQPILKR